MKGFFCVTILCLAYSVIVAQVDTLPDYEEDYYTTMKDLRESEKFRVGVDISTPTVGFLAGVNLRPRAALFFNIKSAPNKAWRFSPMYEQNRRYSDFNTSTYRAKAVNDTSIVYRNEYNEEYRVSLRAGKEWFKQYSKNSLVYGVDAVLGFNSQFYSFTDSYQPYNEDGTVESFTVGAGFFNSEDFYNEEVFRLMLGVDFSIGYKVFLGEKADFTIEWIPEITYRPFLKSVTSDESVDLITSIEDEVVFDIRGISIQLHYKFLKKS